MNFFTAFVFVFVAILVTTWVLGFLLWLWASLMNSLGEISVKLRRKAH